MDKGILSRDFYSNEEYNYGTKYFDAEAYKNNDSNVSDAIDTTRLAKQTMIRSTNQGFKKPTVQLLHLKLRHSDFQLKQNGNMRLLLCLPIENTMFTKENLYFKMN